MDPDDSFLKEQRTVAGAAPEPAYEQHQANFKPQLRLARNLLDCRTPGISQTGDGDMIRTVGGRDLRILYFAIDGSISGEWHRRP